MLDISRKAEGGARRIRRSVTGRTVSTVEPVSQQERVAAARARVVAERKRGVQTEAWIKRLATDGA